MVVTVLRGNLMFIASEDFPRDEKKNKSYCSYLTLTETKRLICKCFFNKSYL